MPAGLEKMKRSPREIARWQKAQQELVAGRHDLALPTYRDQVKRFPDVAQLWFEMGMAAAGLLEFDQADEAFRRAADLARSDVSLLILIGQQYQRLRRLDQARASFQRAVAADTSSVQAQLTLAAWYERERRLEDAGACVEICLSQHPKDSQALCLRALLLHRQDRNAEAEIVLREVLQSDPPDPHVKVTSRHLLGVVLDRLGRYEEALRWMREAKVQARLGGQAARMERDYDEAAGRRRELLAALTPEAFQRWRQEAPAPGPVGLALLGGHPRSGTTLLEQILGAHPAVRAFDEAEAFVQEIWNPLAPMRAPRALTAAELDALPPARLAGMRDRYLKSLLREAGDKPSPQVLLDKNPSPTAALPLWLRVFPRLKVIIALRDPRDVIISCFFQNLAPTPTNVNFLGLERAARHYEDLMDVWLRTRELGGFDWVETRYEDLVNNPEAEGRRVVDFLGLPWREELARLPDAARNKFLFAPTFSDASKPVYQTAVGRWRHYAEALEPLQERLAPYCRAFGYTP